MEIKSILSAWKNQWDSLSYDHMKQFLRDCLQQTKQTVQYMWNNNRGLLVGLLIPVALWAGVFCSPSNSLMFPLFRIATIISILPSIITIGYYLYQQYKTMSKKILTQEPHDLS